MLRTALAALEPGLLALGAVLPQAAGQLLLAAIVALLAYGPGRRLLPGSRRAHPLEEAALAVATGLALFSAFAFALAACGLYGPWLLTTGVLLAQLAAIAPWRRVAGRLRRA
ncbi:MAG TPA: hypothetical protein VHQ65_02675, partial [Thermoanaerobaculia bacterium]|nr:hypothetical protein [Thermoanaerobaculia bacterium]